MEDVEIESSDAVFGIGMIVTRSGPEVELKLPVV